MHKRVLLRHVVVTKSVCLGIDAVRMPEFRVKISRRGLKMDWEFEASNSSRLFL